MAARLWKASERAIAKLLGGQRVPVSGRARGDQPDIRHDWLAVECKSRKALPDWLKDAVAQTRAAQRGGQLPIVVLHEIGERHANDLVVLQLADFNDWFGPTAAEVAP